MFGGVPTMNYAISEVYLTIQGEGTHTGMPAVFVRLQGCDVGCPWCDTRHTWEVNAVHQVATLTEAMSDPLKWVWLDQDALLEIIQQQADLMVRQVVITGGEPFQQGIRSLIQTLDHLGFWIQVETSGCFPAFKRIHPYRELWLTVSPKFAMPGGLQPLPEVLTLASEIKMPVRDEADIDRLRKLVNEYHLTCPVYLQPLSQSKRATALCIEACYRFNWKLSPQMHKYLELP